MVEQSKDPAMAARLENREPGVVLPQHQDAIEGKAEGPTEDDAVRPAVRDHEHPLPRVAGDDRLEGRPRARLHIRPALAFGQLEAHDVGHPRVEGAWLARPALPGPGGPPPAPAGPPP